MAKVSVTLLFGLGLLGFTACGLAADDEAVIKYRQSIMKAVGGHAGALGAIGKGQVPHKSHAAAHAQAIKGLSMQVMDAFKEETVGDSSAKPEVWSDQAGFQKAAEKFQMAASGMASAADGQGDMGAAMKELFEACKGCHKNYRVKKN